VVELWAAWCAPCVEGLPGLRAFAEAHPELTVVVAAVDDAPPDWARHLPRTAPLVTGWAGPQALQALGLPGVPATFLLDPAGEVRAARLGAWTDPVWMVPGGAAAVP
jgi:thiol-disulfide isomerase/thioredoxin